MFKQHSAVCPEQPFLPPKQGSAAHRPAPACPGRAAPAPARLRAPYVTARGGKVCGAAGTSGSVRLKQRVDDAGERGAHRLGAQRSSAGDARRGCRATSLPRRLVPRLQSSGAALTSSPAVRTARLRCATQEQAVGLTRLKITPGRDIIFKLVTSPRTAAAARRQAGEQGGQQGSSAEPPRPRLPRTRRRAQVPATGRPRFPFHNPRGSDPSAGATGVSRPAPAPAATAATSHGPAGGLSARPSPLARQGGNPSARRGGPQRGGGRGQGGAGSRRPSSPL